MGDDDEINQTTDITQDETESHTDRRRVLPEPALEIVPVDPT
jgi:hypothetical protein